MFSIDITNLQWEKRTKNLINPLPATNTDNIASLLQNAELKHNCRLSTKQ